MPLVATRANAGAFGLGWSAAGAGEELGGMVLVTPSSIAYSGTSASIGANGSVEFSAVTSLSLNGVFSADYDNYMIVWRTGTSGTVSLRGRLRASGVDNATASSYTRQSITADGSSVTGARTTVDYAFLGSNYNTVNQNGHTNFIYGPYLLQPTAYRTVTVQSYSGAELLDTAGTHNQSTAYDGFTYYAFSNTLTGSISVYGLVGA
jgi:hypothetical protein